MMVRRSTPQPHHDALLVGVHHDVSQAKAAATPWCPWKNVVRGTVPAPLRLGSWPHIIVVRGKAPFFV